MLPQLLMSVGLSVSIAPVPAVAGDTPSFKPVAGFVPTADVAIAIAVAIWGPIYGKERIEREMPFHARLVDGIWFVSGSLQPGYVGGVAEAQIAQLDGRVLGVLHGK
jgi:NTF2 fold immunity protein